MNKLIEKINSIYNFPEPIRFLGKVRKGYLTSNFIIGSNRKKYFLKGYLDGNRRIINTHNAKFFFAKSEISVILPIHNKQGRTFFAYEKKVYAIFPFVSGKQFKRLHVPGQALAAAGMMLAKLHLLTRNRIPITVRKRKFIVSRKKAIEKCEKLIRLINSKKRKDAFDQEAFAHLQQKLRLIKNKAIKFNRRKFGKQHIIHADYHESNMFFKGTKIQHLFDWEMVSQAPRVMEIARSVDFFCFYGHYEKKNFQMAKQYILAYNSIYAIDKDVLLNGLRAWFHNKLHSMWSFEEYYLNGRKDAVPFIKKELRAYDYYSKNIEDFIEKMEHIIDQQK